MSELAFPMAPTKIKKTITAKQRFQVADYMRSRADMYGLSRPNDEEIAVEVGKVYGFEVSKFTIHDIRKHLGWTWTPLRASKTTRKRSKHRTLRLRIDECEAAIKNLYERLSEPLNGYFRPEANTQQSA